MIEEKYPPISIKDSPAGLEKIMYIQDYSIEKPPPEDKNKEKEFIGVESHEIKKYTKKSKRKPNKEDKKVCVNDIYVNELADYAMEKTSVAYLERMLKNVEEISFLWKEMVSSLQTAGLMFVTPDFSVFDKNSETRKQKEVTLKKEGSQSEKEKGGSNSSLETLEYSQDTKIKMLKLRKFHRIYKKKLFKFLKVQREANNRAKPIFCQFCGLMFQSGRQMGGHMSRQHPGMSSAYPKKCLSRIAHREQKNRRMMWRMVRERTKRGETSSTKKETDFHRSEESSYLQGQSLGMPSSERKRVRFDEKTRRD